MKKIILLTAVLGMGIFNQPTKTASCKFLTSITPRWATLKDIGIATGLIATGYILADLVATKAHHVMENNKKASDQQALQEISEQIHQLYSEKCKLNKKYFLSGIDFNEDLKEFFSANPELIFKPCIVAQNGSFVTPVEFFMNNDEHELVTFLLNMQCHINVIEEAASAA